MAPLGGRATRVYDMRRGAIGLYGTTSGRVMRVYGFMRWRAMGVHGTIRGRAYNRNHHCYIMKGRSMRLYGTIREGA